jgi:putative FmdB family regulatory protein
MPFYEYECQACKFYTEVLQKITDAPLTKCPSCGKRRLKKLVSAPVFRLKGGGWYETDFKSDKESRRNLLGPDKEEPKAEAKAEAKADSKDKPESKEAKPAEGKAPASADKGSAPGKERAGAGSSAAPAPLSRARRAARRSPASRGKSRGRRKERR